MNMLVTALQITLAQISKRKKFCAGNWCCVALLVSFLPVQVDVLLYLPEQDGGLLQLAIVKVIRFVYFLYYYS